jgi:glycogen operon protein
VIDDSFYVLFNAHHEPLQFTLPKPDWGEEWIVALDTARPTLEQQDERHQAGGEVSVESRSLKVLRRVQ